MYLCNRGHEEICHEWSECPLCRILEEKEDLRRELRTCQQDRDAALEDLEDARLQLSHRD